MTEAEFIYPKEIEVQHPQMVTPTNIFWNCNAAARKTLPEVQTRLLRWYAEVQVPRVIWSDNGSQFKSTVTEAVRATLKVQPHYIPPGHPQSNGLVETQLAYLSIAVLS